jgi:hypothetical protein
MNTVARPATSLSGSFVAATPMSTAASYWIGPSTERSGARAHECGRRAHAVDARAAARLARRVGEHGDARLDPELDRSRRRGDGDVGQLLVRRLGVDGAVAVDEHAVAEAHQEDARDDGDARAGLD